MEAGAQSPYIDSLQKIVSENKQDTIESKVLNILASEYTRTDIAKAKSYLYESMQIARRLNSPVRLSYAYSLMVSLQMNSGHADSSQYYLSRLKELSEAASDNYEGRSNYYMAASLFYKMQRNYKEALPYMIESLNNAIARDKKYASSGTRTGLAGQYLNIGNTYTELGEYKKALDYHLHGLQLFEELENKKGQSFCYQSLGGDFLKLGQYRQAMLYTQKALALKQLLNDKRGVGTSYEQTGSIYQGLKQYDRALENDSMALKIYQEMKLVPDAAKENLNLGKLYVMKKDDVHASVCFQNSKSLALQTGDSTTAAAADAELIVMQTKTDKQQSDEKQLMSSLKTSIEMGDKSSEVQNYQFLADHYAANNQFEKALAYSNKYHQVNDSLQGLDVQVQIKKLEAQYNLEKKEQEIVLLKKDQQLNRLNIQKQKTFQLGALVFLTLLLLIGFLIINRNRIVHKSRRLIEMEKMRNHIARDLHDDIGSTLTSINILSKMALEQAHGNGETATASSLLKIKDRSSAIMDSVSDIVWAINPQNDTIEKMIFRMKEFTAEILDPLKISYTFREKGDFSTIKLDIRKRKDLYLVFKEAVNNAAKYSACKNLDIRLSLDQQSLHLGITDDGIGFNPALVKNGNGLANMRERAKAMNAAIQINTATAKGTGILLDVPIT